MLAATSRPPSDRLVTRLAADAQRSACKGKAIASAQQQSTKPGSDSHTVSLISPRAQLTHAGLVCFRWLRLTLSSPRFSKSLQQTVPTCGTRVFVRSREPPLGEGLQDSAGRHSQHFFSHMR